MVRTTTGLIVYRLATLGKVLAFSVVLFSLSLLVPLPETALTREPVHSVRVTDRFGQVLRVVGTDGRFRPVHLADVNDTTVASLIATEDRHFYQHVGISLRAVLRASVENIRARSVVSGGSTLTMQVARAVRNKRKRGLSDKLLEMHLALRLELRLTKNDLLELWLNRVSFGNRMYGIEEAALFYLGKSAKDLTDSEATLLIGIPQSPSRFNPLRHMDRALRRRETVVRAAVRDSVFTTTEAALILETEPILAPRKTVNFIAPHFVDYVRSTNSDDWSTASEVRTTIDPILQGAVEKLGRTHLESVNRLGVSNVSAVVLDNVSGNVLAYLGSADYWNEENEGQNDGVQALRQPGSSLKPFAYAAAFRRRVLSPLSIIPDLPIQVPGAGGAFAPENYDKRFHGPVSSRTALACSYNIPAIRLTQLVTPEELLSDLHSVGFSSLDQNASRYGVGLVLGNGEVTLLQLARAYASLARGGMLPIVRTTDWTHQTNGDTLFSAPPSAVPTVSDEVISYLITDILADPEAREPAFGRGGPLELPFACATKTGTSKDYRDNIAVGYTPRHTVAVWAGNFDGSPMQRVSGISGAGPLMKSILLELGGSGHFSRPPGVTDAIVCDESGKRPGRFCKNLAVRPMRDSLSPSDTCDTHVTVVSDRRTGRLATPTTPSDQIMVTDYLSLPAIYDEWMALNGFQRPPKELDVGVGAAKPLEVLFPMDGSIFQIDPILRPSYQRLSLKAAVSPGIVSPEWWIDGKLHATADSPADWIVQPGWHSIEIHGITSDGVSIQSQPSRIFVGSISGAVGPEPIDAASNTERTRDP